MCPLQAFCAQSQPPLDCFLNSYIKSNTLKTQKCSYMNTRPLKGLNIPNSIAGNNEKFIVVSKYSCLDIRHGCNHLFLKWKRLILLVEVVTFTHTSTIYQHRKTFYHDLSVHNEKLNHNVWQCHVKTKDYSAVYFDCIVAIKAPYH